MGMRQVRAEFHVIHVEIVNSSSARLYTGRILTGIKRMQGTDIHTSCKIFYLRLH